MPEIIAEIANAHQGNPTTAIKLAKSAKNSGADAVKFQIYFADDFISKIILDLIILKNNLFQKLSGKK